MVFGSKLVGGLSMFSDVQRSLPSGNSAENFSSGAFRFPGPQNVHCSGRSSPPAFDSLRCRRTFLQVRWTVSGEEHRFLSNARTAHRRTDDRCRSLGSSAVQNVRRFLEGFPALHMLEI